MEFQLSLILPYNFQIQYIDGDDMPKPIKCSQDDV